MIRSREAPDVLLGHFACLCDLGAVPGKGVYDNEAAMGSKRATQQSSLHEFLAFKGALALARGDPGARTITAVDHARARREMRKGSTDEEPTSMSTSSSAASPSMTERWGSD